MEDLSQLAPANLVYADPPWKRDNNAKSRATERHYGTIDVEEIIALRPPTQRDTVLLLWAISPMLPEAIQVLQGWGFTYKSNMVWTKPQMGLGWWVRQQHEILLIGTKGTPATPLPADRPRSVLSAPRRRHSQKPDEMYDMIDTMFPHLTDRLEMFARNTRPGWTSWGNEVPSDTPEDPGEADTAVGQRKTGEGENT